MQGEKVQRNVSSAFFSCALSSNFKFFSIMKSLSDLTAVDRSGFQDEDGGDSSKENQTSNLVRNRPRADFPV